MTLEATILILPYQRQRKEHLYKSPFNIFILLQCSHFILSFSPAIAQHIIGVLINKY